MKITVDWLKRMGACDDAMVVARKRLNGGLPLAEVIKRLNRADWLIWLLYKSGTCGKRQLQKMGCVAGRLSLPYAAKGDDRPRLAFEAAERAIANPSPNTRHSAASAAESAVASAG